MGDPSFDRAGGPARLVIGGLLGGCGLALLAARAAESGDRFDDGAWGAVLVRADVAAVVAIAAISFLLSTPYTTAHSRGRRVIEPRRLIQGQLAWMYAWWLPAMGVALVGVNPEIGPERIVVTAVFFRDPRQTAPLPGLSIGWVLFVVATAALALPLIDALARRLAAGRSALTGQLGVAAALAAAAVLFRAFVLATGHDRPFGPLSWLPAHLDAVAAGFAASALVAARRSGLVDLDRRRIILAALGSAVAAFLAAAFGAGLPRRIHVRGHDDLFVRGVLYAVVASGLVIAVALVPRWAIGRRLGAVIGMLAFTAPGLLFAGEPAFIILARQYRERITEEGLRLRVFGPVLPLWLWSVLLAAAVGALITAFVVVPMQRALASGWRGSFPYGSTLAGIVAGGFLVRVVTWVTVAPERTDGGDPLFYHVTANTIARGHGFPEPLNWLDSGRHVASALHGPLYPVVLSFSSRMGGVTYVDHKMTSIVIGTATVLVTALVARRLGGKGAALAAGALAAVYPNLWLIDGLMFPEGLFALLTTLCILVAYRWWDRPSWSLAAVLGGIIGLAALTRGEGLLLGVVLVVPWMLARRELPRRRRWRDLVVAGTACVAVLAPWAIRNMTTFEEFVPLSTNGNELIVYANCPTTYSGRLIGFWDFDCQTRYREQFGEPAGDESQKAVFWREVGVDYARDHLGEVPKVVAVRLLRQWELFKPWQTVEFATIEGRTKGATALGLGMYYGLAAASVAGVVILRRRGQRLLPLGAQAIGVTLTAAYAYGTVRFRAPVEPVLCILAGVAAVPIYRWLRRRLAPVPDPPIADGTAYVLGGSGGLRRRHLGALRNWAGIGIVLAAVAIPLRGLFHTTGGTMEEAFMIYFPERMASGDVPNVDFLHLYGPGSLHVLLGWFELFGYNLEAERAFGLLQHLSIIFGLYALARAWGRTAATAVATLSTLLILTPIGLTAMAWNGGLGLCLWAVVVALRGINTGDDRTRRRCWVGAGVLAGLALTYRPDLVLALALAFTWLLWRRSDWRRFLVGGAIGLLPMWVHLAMAGPGRAIEGMLVDPVLHLRAGRELPRPPSWSRIDGSLQAIAEQVPPWWRFPHLPVSKSLFVWFFVMILGIAALVVLAHRLYRRTGGSPRSLVLMAGALLGAGILPQALQRPDSTHLSWVTCISWPLAVIAVIEVVRHRSPHTHPTLRTLLGAAMVAATLFVVAPLFTYRYYLNYARLSVGDVPGPFPVSRDGRRFYLGDIRPYRATRDAITFLDAAVQPGERLFVGPEDLRRTWYSDVYFYYLFPELEPATYFIEMDPGLANAEGSRLADDVASADWVILTGFWNGWYEPNASMDFGSDAPNAVIRDQFCEAAAFEDRLVRIYRRCQ